MYLHIVTGLFALVIHIRIRLLLLINVQINLKASRLQLSINPTLSLIPIAVLHGKEKITYIQFFDLKSEEETSDYEKMEKNITRRRVCLLYTSPSPRD